MVRKLLVATLIGGVVLSTGGLALAGGWATTEFDEPIPELVAGERYAIGFTVLQHGVTPRWTDSVHLRFEEPDGSLVIEFPAEPVGARGHFEAVVSLPHAGLWDLEVDQGFLNDAFLHLEPFDVGPVEVMPAAEGAGIVTPPAPTAPRPAPVADVPESRSGFSVGFGLTMIGVAFVAGAFLAWMASPGTHRRQKVYKKVHPSPEAAWTTKS